MFSGKPFSIFAWHNALLEVDFVGDEQEHNIVVCAECTSLLEPRANGVKRRARRHVVRQNDALRAAIVRRSQRTKALLACCVPDRKLYALASRLDRLVLVVDANGRRLIVVKLVVGEAQQNAYAYTQRCKEIANKKKKRRRRKKNHKQ